MQNEFRIRICSDLDYEEMVADICYENKFVAMITQENGIDKMEIEIFPSEQTSKSWIFQVDDFLKIIMFAKKRLIEMQKLPEE